MGFNLWGWGRSAGTCSLQNPEWNPGTLEHPKQMLPGAVKRDFGGLSKCFFAACLCAAMHGCINQYKKIHCSSVELNMRQISTSYCAALQHKKNTIQCNTLHYMTLQYDTNQNNTVLHSPSMCTCAWIYTRTRASMQEWAHTHTHTSVQAYT